jgi:hypothetical protein
MILFVTVAPAVMKKLMNAIPNSVLVALQITKVHLVKIDD